MTSRDHFFAAARCWEHAGFFPEAAERFSTSEAWRDAGRCFSQVERNADAALAYSRAGEPLLEAREHLMAGWPERARFLYERHRSEHWLSPSAQVEVALGLSEVEEAIRITSTSGDPEAAARLAGLASARGRPDLVAHWLSEGTFAPWNRRLHWLFASPNAETPNIWPSVEFSEVTLEHIWEEETGDCAWGDRALDWSTDSTFFAAALGYDSLTRGRLGPEGVLLERCQPLPERTRCVRFGPASHAVLAGGYDGAVSLVEEDGSTKSIRNLLMPDNVWSIAFNPEGDRVAVGAWTNPGALMTISTWHAGQEGAKIDELRDPEGDCYPLTTWSPNGRQLCWSPGPTEEPNRLFFLDQPSCEAHADRINGLAFTGDSRFLVTASDDQTIVLRDGETGQSLAPPEHFAAAVLGADVHPRAALVAVGEGNRLHLLRLHPSAAHRFSRLSEETLEEEVQSLAFSPDGRHLLVMTSQHLQLFRVDLKP